METSEKAADKSIYERLLHDLANNDKVLHEVRVGKRVGLYRIRGVLGTGSFAQVKLGFHVLCESSVAIKVIDKAGLSVEERRVMSQEISNMHKLDHRNVICLYEVMDSYSKLNLVMEYAKEGTLQHRVINKGPYSEDRGRSIFFQIASAVQYMHSKGVFHRDIKAENVFFVSEFHIKVGDFGFSAHEFESATFDIYCGSPAYAAPELVLHRRYSGVDVDIWALGVMLYFIVTGNIPFRGNSLDEMKRKIVTGIYFVPTKSESCLELISGMLKKNPKERCNVDDVFTSAWIRAGPRPTNTPTSYFEDSKLDDEILKQMEGWGVPCPASELLSEPRSPPVGIYRILHHKKYATEPEDEAASPQPTERTMKQRSRTCALI